MPRQREARFVGLALVLSAAIASSSGLAAPKPIVGAGQWLLDADMPGTPHCSVRRNGAALDVVLAVSNDGKMILMAGHKDWSLRAGPAKLQLTIDKDPPVSLDGHAITALFLTNVSDALQARLEKASTLRWQLPWGTFRAQTAGLGKAFAALKTCEKRKGFGPR